MRRVRAGLARSRGPRQQRGEGVQEPVAAGHADAAVGPPVLRFSVWAVSWPHWMQIVALSWTIPSSSASRGARLRTVRRPARPLPTGAPVRPTIPDVHVSFRALPLASGAPEG